jgi:hypothetical protein
VLKILDDIPEDLLERLLIPPAKDASTIEIQTTMNMNCSADVTKAEASTAFKIAYHDKDTKKKSNGPKNLLLKSIGRYLNGKKEKIPAMGEANAYKMVQGLLEDKLNNDLE